jgi:hypothetical protein
VLSKSETENAHCYTLVLPKQSARCRSTFRRRVVQEMQKNFIRVRHGWSASPKTRCSLYNEALPRWAAPQSCKLLVVLGLSLGLQQWPPVRACIPVCAWSLSFDKLRCDGRPSCSTLLQQIIAPLRQVSPWRKPAHRTCAMVD